MKIINGGRVVLSEVTKKLAASACALALVVSGAQAQSMGGLGASDLVETIELAGPNSPYTGEIAVPAGKSMILEFNRPVREVLVGNPDTADIIPLTERTIYVLGTGVGGTNLTVFGDRKQLLGIIDLQVTHDVLNLKKRLHDLMPGENIEVRTNGGSILLSGTVSSSGAAQKAARLAANYVEDPDLQVVNMIGIGASQQVMLAVRFAEVERSAAKALGISPSALFVGGDGSAASFATNFVTPNAVSGAFAQLFGRVPIGDVTVDGLLDLLEERGVGTILAEPTLIAISGETASFLAGGEFPVPVSSSQNNDDGLVRVGIEFKEFGVRLGFTPTVIGDTISMVVTPEVSELDPQSGISVQGITIPGLRTRRASTTVELKNGQSFAIAGLIQKQFLDQLNQIPGLSSTPILGALARSTSYQRQETELTIIITPYIVEPSDPNTLTTPYDHFTRPHELDLFLLGMLEGGQPFQFEPQKNYFNSTTSTKSAGIGVDGALGYVIE